MLGCQDFCGYYDWTFHYVARRFGTEAVRRLWAQAIGDESQAHYARAGRERGLRGLYETWTKTGQDEHCDWTFTLDEQRNTLRWDMRQCPSKGFLLQNNLNASEDYCDHCMGWMVPLLERIGVEVAAHEHNHCGQCWGEMRVKGRASESLKVACDIRQDPRWNQGFLERWAEGIKLPLLDDAIDAADPCDLLNRWFADQERLLICDSAAGPRPGPRPDSAAVIMTDASYVQADSADPAPRAVLIGDSPANLPGLAERFDATPPPQRPLLMHAYFPGVQPLRFRDYALPRPVPVLPLLIRAGRYRHRPGGPLPTQRDLLIMLAVCLGKPFELCE